MPKIITIKRMMTQFNGCESNSVLITLSSTLRPLTLLIDACRRAEDSETNRHHEHYGYPISRRPTDNVRRISQVGFPLKSG
jgi:hypothetical protein